MRENCCPEAGTAEAITLDRSEADGCIDITLRIAPEQPPDFDDTLALLSCWWLRWIAQVDCRFHFDGQAWLARCRLPSHAHRLLPQLLRDLSAIKNVVCL